MVSAYLGISGHISPFLDPERPLKLLKAGIASKGGLVSMSQIQYTPYFGVLRLVQGEPPRSPAPTDASNLLQGFSIMLCKHMYM